MTLSAPNRLNLVQKDVPGTKEETNLRSLFEYIKSIDIMSGRLIEEITTSTSGFNVNHGLQRKWRGFFITKCNTSVQVWAPAVQADSSKYLTLDSDAATTIDIWVF